LGIDEQPKMQVEGDSLFFWLCQPNVNDERDCEGEGSKEWPWHTTSVKPDQEAQNVDKDKEADMDQPFLAVRV